MLISKVNTPSLTFRDLFHSLPSQTLAGFLAIQKRAIYSKGKVLYAVGQKPVGAFMLHTGKVRLSISGSRGGRLALRTARPPDVIGVWATLAGDSYIMTAETLCSSEIGFVAQQDFVEFLHDDCEFAFRMLQLVSEEALLTLGQARSFLQTPTPRRKS